MIIKSCSRLVKSLIFILRLNIFSLQLVKSFRLFDKVLCNGEARFVFGRCSSRYFDIPTLSERKISAGISYKTPSLLEKRKTYLIELKKGGSRDSSRV